MLLLFLLTSSNLNQKFLSYNSSFDQQGRGRESTLMQKAKELTQLKLGNRTQSLANTTSNSISPNKGENYRAPLLDETSFSSSSSSSTSPSSCTSPNINSLPLPLPPINNINEEEDIEKQKDFEESKLDYVLKDKKEKQHLWLTYIDTEKQLKQFNLDRKLTNTQLNALENTFHNFRKVNLSYSCEILLFDEADNLYDQAGTPINSLNISLNLCSGTFLGSTYLVHLIRKRKIGQTINTFNNNIQDDNPLVNAYAIHLLNYAHKGSLEKILEHKFWTNLSENKNHLRTTLKIEDKKNLISLVNGIYAYDKTAHKFKYRSMAAIVFCILSGVVMNGLAFAQNEDAIKSAATLECKEMFKLTNYTCDEYFDAVTECVDNITSDKSFDTLFVWIHMITAFIMTCCFSIHIAACKYLETLPKLFYMLYIKYEELRDTIVNIGKQREMKE